MIEQLIEFKTANLAKEKCFDESCDNVFDEGEVRRLMYYEGDGTGFVKNSEINNEYESFLFTNPTQSLLAKWLREVHNINVYCMPCEHNEKLWYNNIASQTPVFTGTYEEALEIGLQEGLKLIP